MLTHPKKCILDPLIISNQWFDESVIIFVRSAEFQFECFQDLKITSDRLAPYMKKNIVAICWRSVVLPSLDMDWLMTSYPHLKRLRIFVDDAVLRRQHFGHLPTGMYHQREASRHLITGAIFERYCNMKGLRSIRGLEDFSWIRENQRPYHYSRDLPGPLVPGRTIYERNWDAFSEWISESVTKQIET